MYQQIFWTRDLRYFSFDETQEHTDNMLSN